MLTLVLAGRHDAGVTLSPSSLRVAAALAVAAHVGACSKGAECDESACGTGGGTVTSVRADGSRAWTAPVRDTGATVLVQEGTVVVDGCRAVTVLDAVTGRVLLETEEVADAGAVVAGVLVGSARTGDDDPLLVGIRLDGARGGYSWARTAGSARVAPSPVARTGSGFAVAFGDSLDVVTDPAGATDPPPPVQLPSEVVGAPAALPDGVVLAATADGSVYGIRDGALRWRVVPELVGARITTGVTPLGGGALISSSSSGDLAETSFTTAAGEVRWRAPGAVPGDSVLGAGTDVALLWTPTGTRAHDLRTGLRLWEGPEVDRDATVVSAVGGVALTERGPGGPNVVVRDPGTGSTLWDRRGEVTGAAGPTAVLMHDAVEVRGAGTVSALDAATGDVLWVLPVATSDPASAVVTASATTPATTLVVDVPPRPMMVCE